MKNFIIRVYKAEVKYVKKFVNSVGKFVKRLVKYGPKGAVAFAVAESETAKTVGGMLEGNRFNVVSLDE